MNCSWMTLTHPTTQCRWPAVFSNGLQGDGKWRCYMHHKLSNEGSDQVTADAVVEASIDWDGSALDYIHYRKQFDETPRVKKAVAREEEGISNIGDAVREAWKLLQKKGAAHAA